MLQYTEGTWTPVIAGTTTAGAGTYTLQTGTYTRMGNLCFLAGTVTWTAHTGTGNMLLTGLPFTSRTLANYKYSFEIISININFPAGTISVEGSLPSTSTQLTLQSIRDNNTQLAFSMDIAGTISVTGFYLI